MKVSVCMVTRNRENLMLHSIKCILDQTFKDFEFIIVDDGSTDNTVKVLEKIQKQDDRIVIIKNKHDFINSRTLALKSAKGEYIALIDSDDLCMPNRLEEQLKFFEKHPELDIVGCTIKFGIQNNGTDFGKLKLTVNDFTHEIFEELINKYEIGNICHFPSIMIKKSALNIFNEKIFYPELFEGGEDQCFLYTLYFKGKKFGLTSNTCYLYNYCIYSDSVSNNSGKHFADNYFFKNIFNKSLEEKKKIIENLYNKYKYN